MNPSKITLLLLASVIMLMIPCGNLSSWQRETSDQAEITLPSEQSPLSGQIATAEQKPSQSEHVTHAAAVSETQNKSVKFPEGGVPVLMYHSISTNPGNSLCVSEKQFEEELAWLHSQNYHTITADQFCDALLSGAQLPEKPVLLTFDDGYKDNYQAAWPIMKKYGFVGTFFIITNSVGPNSIDWEQLSDLLKSGNSIGSHSVHHLDMATLKESSQESELLDSKKTLESRLGISVSTFCYPAGKYNQTTINLLSKLGYKAAFTTASGYVRHGDNQYKLTRLRISGGMSLSSFKGLLS